MFYFDTYVIAWVAATGLFLWGMYTWRKRPKNFPPGPTGLPVLGSVNKMSRRAELDLMVSEV